MALLEGLDLAAQLGFSDLEVESDSAIVVFWAILSGSMRWDFAYLLGCVLAHLLLLGMFFKKLHLLLILWPTGRVLIRLVSDFQS